MSASHPGIVLLSASASAVAGRAGELPSCGTDAAQHCITCSDEGLPMRVTQILDNGVARCTDSADRSADVLTALVGDVAVGDLLLIHAGTALLRLTEPDREQA